MLLSLQNRMLCTCPAQCPTAIYEGRFIGSLTLGYPRPSQHASKEGDACGMWRAAKKCMHGVGWRSSHSAPNAPPTVVCNHQTTPGKQF